MSLQKDTFAKPRKQAEPLHAPLPEPAAVSPRTFRSAEVSEKIFALYDRMIGNVDIPDVLRDVADVVCNDLHAHRASIYLIDKDTHELRSVAVIGNVAQTIRVPISGTSLAGFCALNARSFVVPDAYGDLRHIDPALRFDDRWDRRNNFRTRDVMCAPALFKGEVMGVVQVVNSKSTPFAESDLPALETTSRLIGYAMYHARLYDDLATMKRLDKEKAEFMRIMVHELRSPVAAARMMASAMTLTNLGPEKVVDFAGRITGRMDQLMTLIRDLLDLAKVKAGQAMSDVVPVDLVEALGEICEQYETQAKAKGLSLERTLADEPIIVRMDRQGCDLLLSNLVSNAVKYTNAGFVRVRLAKDDGQAVVEVADSGIGIPEVDVPKLFREFYRASNAKKSGIQGTGVGLAGAKVIAERFGGTFALDTQENKGSTFTVRLPLYDPQDDSRREPL